LPSLRDVPIKLACEKCGSENIIPNTHLWEDVFVTVTGPRRIEAFDPVHGESRLITRVCGDCGHIELSVENPAVLLQAYRKIGT
jgi:uncharacterized OB-fold protein